MTKTNPEFEKVHLLLSEAAKLWEKNQVLVSSRNFFCLWLDSCKPRPFAIPVEGLVLNRQQVVKPAEEEQADRVGYFTWAPASSVHAGGGDAGTTDGRHLPDA